MAKPIRLTEKLIVDMTREFYQNLCNAKMSDGKITYTKAFTYPGEPNIKADVWFTPEAYSKMIGLVQEFDSEVAWHGVVERTGDTEFIIKDILVYPQVVSGATVNTDQEKYQRWLMELDDEVANHLHMQGHSHVRMGTSPSVTDTTHQEQIIAQLEDDMFYIFLIWNKRMEYTVKVYDNKFNTLYENSDVNIGVLSDGLNLVEFIKDAKSVVETKAYSSNVKSIGYSGNAYGGNYGSNYGGSYGGNYGETKRKTGFQSEEKPTSKGKSKYQYDDPPYGQVDFDDYVYNGGVLPPT